MNRHHIVIAPFAALALAAGVAWLVAHTGTARGADQSAPRVFELRTYTAAEGKLDALHARFRDHTHTLFLKHHMTPIAYWTPTEPDLAKTTLVYILAFPSLEAREQAWKDFQADPDWKAAKEASEKDGKLVVKVESKFLAPTDYSPLK